MTGLALHKAMADKAPDMTPITVTTDLGKMFRGLGVGIYHPFGLPDFELYGKAVDGIFAAGGAFTAGIGWPIVGIIIGGWLVGRMEKESRHWAWYPPELLLLSFIGGMLFSYGTRLAGACTLYHLTGGMLLGLGAAMLIGCEIPSYLRIGLGYLSTLIGFMGFAVGYLPFGLNYQARDAFFRTTLMVETYKLYELIAPGNPMAQKLILALGKPGDAENDPAQAWPEVRQEVKVGTLKIVSANRKSGGRMRADQPRPRPDHPLHGLPGPYAECARRWTRRHGREPFAPRQVRSIRSWRR